MTREKVRNFYEILQSAPLEIRPGKAALLIIDMQEYQTRKNWGVYKFLNGVVPGILDYYVDRIVETAEPNIKLLADSFRARGQRVVYTLYSSFNRDGSDMPAHIRQLNESAKAMTGDVLFPHVDAPGSKIVLSLEPHPEDLVVVKNTSGVFYSTRIEFLLRNLGVEQVFVTGVVTNMCVENAARGASDLGFDTYIVEDACAAWSPETHEATLLSFGMMFGKIVKTNRVLEQLG